MVIGDAGQSSARLPGWYGKLPALGDFASRRLSPGFVAAWDKWLSTRMAGSRAELGDSWLAAYLACPVWRFLLMPGTLDGAPQCWAGVMMASVDRVGRHFPFTIAAALPAVPVTGADVTQLWDWLGRIEHVALDVLEFDHAIGTLEASLALCPIPMPTPLPQGTAALSQSWRIGSRVELTASLAAAFAAQWHAQARGLSFWSTALPGQQGPPDDPPYILVPAPGLPDQGLFVAMLGNRCGESIA